MESINQTHELYHRKTRASFRAINEKNFTYRLIIMILDRYLKGKVRILDIGCGAGSLSFYLNNKGNKILGVDVSKKAIEQCLISASKMRLKNIRFLKAEFPKVKINNKFDSVVFTEVIEHLSNDRLALKKIHTLLHEDGVLFLSTPSINAPLHRLGLTKKFDKEVGHLRRYDLKHLKKLLNESGFRIIEIKKTEGIIRNFLFVNPFAGKLVRFLNFSTILSDIVTFLDNISLALFGESNYIIVARKVKKTK